MDINFKGLVELHNLPSTEPLLPLFEAIVNSIQSINQGNIEDGQISIYIERETSQNLFNTGDWETDIENITIVDNGVGFTEENYKSFNTYATDFKKMLGCKGVGRMTWLKAFDFVEIESVFNQDGNKYKRKFAFDSENAVNNNKVDTIDNSVANSTKVRLVGLRSRNKSNTPKKLSTIARDILNHCFIYFVLNKAPKIVVSDDNNSISINALFADISIENICSEHFSIGKHNFSLIHFKNHNPNSNSHCLNLCANERRVLSVSLQNILIGINSKFISDNGDFVYNGYITSKYLDDNVNRERTAFNIEDSEDSLISEITKNDIVSAASELILPYLNTNIESYNKSKKEKIEKFIFEKILDIDCYFRTIQNV